MRQAYPGNYGYGPYSSNAVNGGPSDSDRLSNLKQAIDAIEQRLAGAPVPPYAQLTPGQNPSSGQLSAMQAQLNQLAGQLRAPQAMPSAHSHAPVHAPAQSGDIQHDVNSATAAIAQRQQALNAGTAAQQVQNQVVQSTKENMAAITSQLDGLKNELASIKTHVEKPVAIQQSVPQEEIDRIAAAISQLQQTEAPDESAFDRLTVELDQLRKVMKNDVRSAVEEEIQTNHAEIQASNVALHESTETHAAALHERLDALASGLTQGLEEMSLQSANQVTPRVENLANQLDALRMTVDDLPQTLAISRLEEHLQGVVQKMDNLSALATEAQSAPAQSGLQEEDLANIEKRLDEISRALVAVSNSAGKAPVVDLTGLERVEARMSELSRTMDGLAANDSSKELGNLAVRIDGLTDRLGSFEKYAEAGDLGAANAMFAAPDTGMIEDQLRALNARLDETMAQSQTAALEEQIRQLSARVEEASNVNSTAAQMSNLEAQIGQIIRQMEKQGNGASIDFSPVEARLGQIETHLASHQSNPVEAAQQAAQQAVAMMGSQSESGQIIEALSHDLKALQLASEGNASQNTQTVAQVQSALEQVIERLGSIEGSMEEVATRTATIVASPPAMPAATNLVMPAGIDASGANAQHTNEAAFAADGLVDAAKADEDLGVIHKAAVDAGYVKEPYGAPSGHQQTPPQMAAPSIDPTDHLESSMPSSPEDNMPLEPGSNVPDVERLVEQASAKLQNQQANPADASSAHRLDEARPDAVAAARRALQATTAEMNAVRDEVKVEKKSESAVAGLKGKLEQLVPNFDMSKLRKPLVMGAAALLLAIVAFKGVGMFTGGDPKPVANIEVPAVEMNSGEAPKTEMADAVTAPESNIRTIGELSQNNDDTNAAPTENAQVAPKVEQVEQPAVTDVAPVSTAPEIVVNETPSEAVSQTADFEVPASAGPAALVAAAKAGDSKALYQIGMRYSDGNEVKRNIAESAKWFERSANTGFAPAQYSIGSLYEKGIGVERDIVKASQWYEKASAQGNARAMHNLAVIKAMGNPPSVQPDMDTAVVLFKQAADLGIKDSQFNLGILYGQGMGVPQNLSESYKWFALAAKTGDTDAGKKRDEVANAMDPDDLDDARKEVNNWAPGKLKEAENRVSIPDEWKGRGSAKKAVAASGTASVEKAQFLLNQRGFNVGTPDGVIGPKTKRAIMEFQRSAGIPITGRVDQKLLKALDI